MKRIILLSILLFNSSVWSSAQTEEKTCPKFDVSALFEFVEVGDAAIFSVETSKEIENYNVKYNWLVRNGELLDGQGSKNIRVLRLNGDVVLVGVQIEGLPKNCVNTDSAALPAIDRRHPLEVDRYATIDAAAEEARLYDFYIQIEADKNAEGYIIITGKNAGEIKPRLNFLNRYFNKSNGDKTRISYIISNEKKNETVLFLIPSRVESPCPNCLIIRAEDFERLASLFQSTATKKTKK